MSATQEFLERMAAQFWITGGPRQVYGLGQHLGPTATHWRYENKTQLKDCPDVYWLGIAKRDEDSITPIAETYNKRHDVGGFETDTASRETHVHTRKPVRM